MPEGVVPASEPAEFDPNGITTDHVGPVTRPETPIACAGGPLSSANSAKLAHCSCERRRGGS